MRQPSTAKRIARARSWLLITALLTGLSGCLGSTPPTETTQTPGPSAAPAAQATASPTDVVAASATPQRATPTHSWELSWSDEFDGPAGSLPDPTKWMLEETGNPPNSELQYYTARPENIHLNGQGQLEITALKENYIGREYTSGRVKTQGLFEQKFGRVEARLKLPTGKGFWPAFWMLGHDYYIRQWPLCGEIDIMENLGHEPNKIYGTAHGPTYFGGATPLHAPYVLPSGTVHDDFHVYAVEWEPSVIRWYVDDVLYQTRTPADLPDDAQWVYNKAFFIILNVAVGGLWPGNPTPDTVFPQSMQVDYVRAYQRPEPWPTLTPYIPPPTATPLAQGEALRIDFGAAEPYTDQSGNLWRADTLREGAALDHGTLSIAGAEDPVIYRTERREIEDFEVNLPNGTYTVRLHFAETIDGVTAKRQHVFSVDIESKTVIKNLDIFAETGGANKALVKTVEVTLTDGTLNMKFRELRQSTTISGLEIIPAGS